MPTAAVFLQSQASSHSQSHHDEDAQSDASDAPPRLYFPNDYHPYDNYDNEDSSQSQPLTDWSQSVYGDANSDSTQLRTSQVLIPPAAGTQLTHPVTALPSIGAPPIIESQLRIPQTPAPRIAPTSASPVHGLKRAAPDNIETPASKRKEKFTSAAAINGMSRSVDNVADAFREAFKKKESSATSPTKLVARARELAAEDEKASVIDRTQRVKLSLIFVQNPKTADAYTAEEDADGRLALAEVLLASFKPTF